MSERRGQAPGRRSEHRRRIVEILAAIEPTREQLIAAMGSVSAEFDFADLLGAAQSSDPDERNKVAAIERNLENLVNWLHDLAARALVEGIRLGAIKPAQETSPWQRLVELEVITQGTADRLLQARGIRNVLGHHYAPAVTTRETFEAANLVLGELDEYVVRLQAWATSTGVL